MNFISVFQVAGCEGISEKIGEIIYLDDENNQKISSFALIPNDFFEDMETSWKGRVKRIHIDDVFIEVERAAEALSLAVGICSSCLLNFINYYVVHCIWRKYVHSFFI